MVKRKNKKYIFEKQIFGILLTAFFLTIFELIFFKLQVAPLIEDSIDEQLGRINTEFGEYLNLSEEFKNYFEILTLEEKELIDKLNWSIIIDGSYIVVILLLMLVYILFKVHDKYLLLHKDIYFFSFGSLVLFVIFQIYFFFLNQNYNYATLDETIYKLKVEFLNNL